MYLYRDAQGGGQPMMVGGNMLAPGSGPAPASAPGGGEPYSRLAGSPGVYTLPNPGGDPFAAAGLIGGYPPSAGYPVPGNPYPMPRGNNSLPNRYPGPTPQAFQQQIATLHQMAQTAAMSTNPQNPNLGLGQRPASTGAPMPSALRTNPGVQLPPGLLPQNLATQRLPGAPSPAPPNGQAGGTTTTTPAALFARLSSSNPSLPPGLPQPTATGPAGTYSPSGELIAMVGMAGLGLPDTTGLTRPPPSSVEFRIQDEREFPSLSAASNPLKQSNTPSPNPTNIVAPPNSLSSSSNSIPPTSVTPGAELSEAFNVYQAQIQAQLQQANGLGLGGGLSSLSTSSAASAPNAASQRPADPWGLLGLGKVLKMTDKDLSALTLGTDLTGLGLNLSSPDVLYASFASPWAQASLKRKEPEFHIPSCYYIPQLPPATDKLNLFSDETLFYLFYSMPKDALQMSASAELYSRDWRYHTELQTWFHRLPGTEPAVKGPGFERGSYIYFDLATWSQARKDNFTLEYDKLETQMK